MCCCYAKTKIFLLFALTWLYLWLRAIYVPFVHDESATFFIYLQSGEFLPYHSYPDANNHLLNSLLASLSFQMFGAGKLALRLPNLLLWPVFFFSVHSISCRINDSFSRWMVLLGLVLAHNFIEFFGLCRGYGISMAFLMMAVLFLLRVFERQRNIDRIFALLAMLLALSANLTLINTSLILIALVWISVFFDENGLKSKLGNLILLMVISMPLFIYLIQWMVHLKATGLLYYHSVEGFLAATPGTLSAMLTGIEGDLLPWLLVILFVIVGLLSLFTLFKSLTIKTWTSPGLLMSMLLLGSLAAIMAEHFLFGINYPEDRTAMFLYPLLVLSLAFLLDKEGTALFKTFRYPAMALFLFFPAHYLYSINVSHSSLWYQEGIPQSFYDTILKDSGAGKQLPSVGGYMLRRFCWGYINYTHQGQLPMIKTSSYPEMIADYQIVHMNKNLPWLFYYQRLAYDGASGLSLLKRKHLFERQEVFSLKDQRGSVSSSEEYFGLLEKEMSGYGFDNIFIEINFNLETDETPFPSSLILKIENGSGEVSNTESIELNWYPCSWQGKDTHFRQGMLVTNIPKDAVKASLYLVNSKKQKFTLKGIQVRGYQLINTDLNIQP
jgi:hypothetical protein